MLTTLINGVDALELDDVPRTVTLHANGNNLLLLWSKASGEGVYVIKLVEHVTLAD